MSETLLSAGVLARENDSTQIQSQPSEFGAAIIGATAKGPNEIPTVVTSFSEYKAVFGDTIESGSNVYSYLTSISANNYFQNGGTSLLVTRVTSGSFSSATSVDSTGTETSAFVLETLSEGEIMNSHGAETAGALDEGTRDNIRWEIPTVNTSSGTFSLLIRRGDDNARNKVVLETYSNLSLDPYEPNYISKVIGDISHEKILDTSTNEYYIRENGSYPNISNYVRVKQVKTPTPNYLDNSGTPNPSLIGSMPSVESGSFDGATGSNIPSSGSALFYKNINASNIQGLDMTDYDSAIKLLSNKDEYQFNSITAPGLNNAQHPSQVGALADLALERRDCIAIIDLVPYGAEINAVIQDSTTFDNSYTSTYWPWLQTLDPNTGELVFVPASTMIPGVYAFTDASSEPWFAPAGITRGGLTRVTRAERKITVGNRDTLYEANVNPIATFPSSGVVVYGQKTLQKRSTALDRVNVRRLLIELKGYISQIANNLVFDQNSISTRNSFLSQVNPYLDSIQQRQGLYAFKVIMDASNNTSDVIDRNELVGQIYLQPTRTAEFILLDFNVTPTGTVFPE